VLESSCAQIIHLLPKAYFHLHLENCRRTYIRVNVFLCSDMGNSLPKFVPEFRYILCNMEDPYIKISEPTHTDGRSPLQGTNLTTFYSLIALYMRLGMSRSKNKWYKFNRVNRGLSQVELHTFQGLILRTSLRDKDNS